MSCVEIVNYHIVQKGEKLGPVPTERELQQGDQLSPYVFVICAKGLFSALQDLERQSYSQVQSGAR